MAGKGSKSDKRGRRKGEGQFWCLPYFMAHHPNFLALSGNAVKVLVELRTRYAGPDAKGPGANGPLPLALKEAADRLGIGKATVQRALRDLREAGFIEQTHPGAWIRGYAATFRLTFEPCDGAPATNEWQRSNKK